MFFCGALFRKRWSSTKVNAWGYTTTAPIRRVGAMLNTRRDCFHFSFPYVMIVWPYKLPWSAVWLRFLLTVMVQSSCTVRWIGLQYAKLSYISCETALDDLSVRVVVRCSWSGTTGTFIFTVFGAANFSLLNGKKDEITVPSVCGPRWTVDSLDRFWPNWYG